MKKLCLILCVVFTLLCFAPLTACSKTETLILNVYNWEEYIAEDDYVMVEEFEKWYKQEYGQEVEVKYSTFGTNENMYNELKLTQNKRTGNYTYDLVCPSDYMIQKMIKEDMVESFDFNPDGTYTYMDNYDNYASGYIKNLFKDNNWYDKAICYMWGTMGFVYNPDVMPDGISMANWSDILNKAFDNKSTIKDSPRDSYILALGIAYQDELLEQKQKFDDGEIGLDEYQTYLNELFNNADQEHIDKAGEILSQVKKCIYGFEVDSGKQDMASGKIWINFAWSGDAVYTLDVAEEETGVELYYSVPEEGSNIFFDGWVMPKGANKQLAQIFLNFISRPDNAIENMNYIGYTPAIAGDEMFQNAIDWYGLYVFAPVSIIAEPDEESLYTFSINDNDVTYQEIYFGDLTEQEIAALGGTFNEEEGTYDFATLIYPEYDDDDNVIGFYTEQDVSVYAVDLSYFFDNLSEDYQDAYSATVYTDTINRQFTAQYPDSETVNRCAIMEHFDKEQLTRLNSMWESVKIGYMSPITMVIIVAIVALLIVAYILINKFIKSGKLGYGKERKGLTLVSREEIK